MTHKNAKELLESLDKFTIKESFAEGDLVIAQQLAGNENRFFAIFLGSKDISEEELGLYYPDKQVAILKPLCTKDGDKLSDLHDLEEDGTIILGLSQVKRKADKADFEKCKNRAIERAKRFEEIQI